MITREIRPAGQVTERRGAAGVIGGAGSPAKAAYRVDELGYDAAFDLFEGDFARVVVLGEDVT